MRQRKHERLVDAAREVVRAWHEDTNDLNMLAGAIERLEKALETMGYPFAFTTPEGTLPLD